MLFLNFKVILDKCIRDDAGTSDWVGPYKGVVQR